MIIQEDEYKLFHEWITEYIADNCIFYQGKSEWSIDTREDKSYMPGKTNSIPIPDAKFPNPTSINDPHGDTYAWQFYLRRGCFDAVFNSVMAQMFIYKVEREIGHFDFQLTGLETAATPMLSAIPLVARNFGIELNSFVSKKEQKAYGVRNWVEGCPIPKLPVMIIDDLVSTSNSMRQARYITEKFVGLETMEWVFGIVNKHSKTQKSWNFNNSMTHCDKMPDRKILYLCDCDDFNLDMSVIGPTQQSLQKMRKAIKAKPLGAAFLPNQ